LSYNCNCRSLSTIFFSNKLKQQITKLIVDIQNHILAKRRLEISMINLENDCKIIDAERIRLNNDIKHIQLSQ
jgi:hypothetical protein